MTAGLHSYLDRFTETPLEPGVHDCALFVAGWVAERTGVDHAAAYRGRYASFDEGRATAAAAGFADLVAMLEEHLPEVAPAYAQVGDVAVLETGEWGICCGDLIACTGKTGLAYVRRRRMVRGFRVG